MAALSHARIAELLAPYVAPILPELIGHLSVYLDLLVKWNGHTNLTATRDPEAIVTRHFGESLFTGVQLPQAETLLDYGSGAGFPGVPINLMRREMQVTLAESQNKKAAFLREAVRVLGLEAEVWAQRVEEMPAERRFDLVTLRAVDVPGVAAGAALLRVRVGGSLVQLTARASDSGEGIAIPGDSGRTLVVTQMSVPRGTPQSLAVVPRGTVHVAGSEGIE